MFCREYKGHGLDHPLSNKSGFQPLVPSAFCRPSSLVSDTLFAVRWGKDIGLDTFPGSLWSKMNFHENCPLPTAIPKTGPSGWHTLKQYVVPRYADFWLRQSTKPILPSLNTGKGCESRDKMQAVACLKRHWSTFAPSLFSHSDWIFYDSLISFSSSPALIAQVWGYGFKLAETKPGASQGSKMLPVNCCLLGQSWNGSGCWEWSSSSALPVLSGQHWLLLDSFE